MSEEIEGWQSRRLSQPVRPTKRVSAGRKKHNIRPSRLTETSAYEGWLLQQADRAKSKANFDSDPTVHAKNRMTARSERMRVRARWTQDDLPVCARHLAHSLQCMACTRCSARDPGTCRQRNCRTSPARRAD